jgi:hypothetical protein
MRSAVVLACASLLFACAADPDTSSVGQNAETHNRISTNRIATNRIATNRIATNQLAGAALSRNRLEVKMPEAAPLLATADGRDVYSYLVSCAVPSGITLEADIPGATNTTPDDPYTCVNGHCTFDGSVGIAPGWLNHKLDSKGQDWVSSCMFARCNAHDTAEAISMRGNSRALAVSADEAALYSVEEGAFYGNMFTDDNAPIAWYACEGEGQASGEFGGLVDRDCTEPQPCNTNGTCGPSPSCAGPNCPALTCGPEGYCHDQTLDGSPVVTQCGFNWAGYCADYTPQYPSPYACRTFDSRGGYYADCHDSSGQGKWKHIKEWDRVITTFVTP